MKMPPSLPARQAEEVEDGEETHGKGEKEAPGEGAEPALPAEPADRQEGEQQPQPQAVQQMADGLSPRWARPLPGRSSD